MSRSNEANSKEILSRTTGFDFEGERLEKVHHPSKYFDVDEVSRTGFERNFGGTNIGKRYSDNEPSSQHAASWPVIWLQDQVARSVYISCSL